MHGTRGVAGLLAALALVAVGCTSSPTSDSGGGGGGDAGGGGSGEQVTLDFWVFEGGTTGFLEALRGSSRPRTPTST